MYVSKTEGGGRIQTPRKNVITVGMGDMKVSKDPNAEFVTHALGSCIAVMVHDPVRLVGGMIHYMLPLSKNSKERAKIQPAMFADVGIPKLFKELYALGAKKTDLIIKVAGGASINKDGEMFQIGKRNFAILRKMFWKNQIVMSAHQVGGNNYRTARLCVRSGQVSIKTKVGESIL